MIRSFPSSQRCACARVAACVVALASFSACGSLDAPDRAEHGIDSGGGGGGSSVDAAATNVIDAGNADGPIDTGVAPPAKDAGGGGAADAGHSFAIDALFCSAALDDAAADFKGFLAAYTDPTKVPRSVKGTAVRIVGVGDWTSGFDAGIMWLLYEHTHDDAYRKAAEAWTNALYGQRTRTDTHDIGFAIIPSYGNGYRLTQNPDYAPVIVEAAKSLATRFHPVVGATRSWDGTTWSYPVIIDNMMNLELLHRGTTLGGSATYSQMAATHAKTTLTNHFRPDYSSFHLVDYDANTGAVLKRQTVQGIADDSAWARGQAWGLYGFTMSHRETKEPAFLAQATAIAEFYTTNAAMPADGVPYFDFATFTRADIPDYRDASAGAVAASALLELAAYVPGAAARRYREFAINALRSLASPSYRASAGQNGNFLLMHTVGNYPANDEIDVGMNYADYYFVEALLRCAALK